MNITIRTTTPDDEPAIHRLHSSAFEPGEARAVADLAVELLHDPTAEPMRSLAAEYQADLVGHVLFTLARIVGPGNAVDARILAPLAVAPDHQARGIGARLVRDGLKQLADDGCQLVFVLGDPAYYNRFGFHPATPHGLIAPHPIPPQHHDAWMVIELAPDTLGRARGNVQCATSLNKPEHWIE